MLYQIIYYTNKSSPPCWSQYSNTYRRTRSQALSYHVTITECRFWNQPKHFVGCSWRAIGTFYAFLYIAGNTPTCVCCLQSAWVYGDSPFLSWWKKWTWMHVGSELCFLCIVFFCYFCILSLSIRFRFSTMYLNRKLHQSLWWRIEPATLAAVSIAVHVLNLTAALPYRWWLKRLGTKWHLKGPKV